MQVRSLILLSTCTSRYTGRDLRTIIVENYGYMEWLAVSTRYFDGPTFYNYGTIEFTGATSIQSYGSWYNYGSMLVTLPSSATTYVLSQDGANVLAWL